jgi:transcriptional regulator with XRE-family HTH domain
MQGSTVSHHKHRSIQPRNQGGSLVIAAKLRQLRADAGLTQRSLAIRADVTVNTVSELERGENNNPELKTLLALAAALGVPVAALFEEPATTNGGIES